MGFPVLVVIKYTKNIFNSGRVKSNTKLYSFKVTVLGMWKFSQVYKRWVWLIFVVVWIRMAHIDTYLNAHGVILGGVTLLKGVCHWGWVLRSQMRNPGPVSLSSCCLLVQMWNSLLPPQHHDSLHASCHDNSGLNLWTVSQTQLNIFLYEFHGVSSHQ